MTSTRAPSAEPRSPALVDGPRDGAWRPFYRLVGLLFVAVPVATILSGPRDPLEVALVLLGSGLFGLVLLLGTRVPRPGPDGVIRPTPVPRSAAEIVRTTGPAVAAVIGLLGLSLALTVLRPDTGWFAFFYFASTSASTIRVPRIAIGLMIISGLAAALSFVAVHGDVADAFVQGLSVSVIGLTVFSAIAVRRTNRALVAARDELARLAVADERARIARDLHDTLGHDLSVIALKSELAGRLLPDDPARARAEIGDVERVAREALTAVRGTIGGYRQPTLAGELAGARTALATAGIAGRVEPAPEGLPPAVDAILAWAVREGVTNILRHARAGTAEIRLQRTPSEVTLEIDNDRLAGAAAGRPAGDEGVAPGSGTGLIGLRERVAAGGGEVATGPDETGGFRLRVRLPIDDPVGVPGTGATSPGRATPAATPRSGATR